MFSIRNFSVVFLTSLLAACGSSSSGPRNVEIDVSAILGGEPFACDRLFDGVGDTDATVDPIDLRLYVSEVELVREDGNAVPVDLTQDGEWQYQNVALLDFENGTGLCGQRGTPETNTTIRGTVPDGNYTAVRFVMGVPETLNHIDAATAPSPLNKTALWWNWNMGYKFIRFDMEVLDGDAISEFRVHIGSTMCEGDMAGEAICANPNRTQVDLVEWSGGRGSILMDLDSIFVGTDVQTNLPDTPPGCMSRPDDGDCGPIFERFGLPFMGSPASEQKVFFPN
jgi:uncharacterized repeat protein (TIGR04052 family)